MEYPQNNQYLLRGLKPGLVPTLSNLGVDSARCMAWGVMLSFVCTLAVGCTAGPLKNLSAASSDTTAGAAATPGQPVGIQGGGLDSSGADDTQTGATNPAPDGHVIANEPPPSPGLSTCLYEAEQLNRLGTPAQKNLVTGLYRNIRAAQQYEPMAGKLAAGTSNTVGPLYQFAINDACNAVSQGLLTVLKKQVPVAGGGRD